MWTALLVVAILLATIAALLLWWRFVVRPFMDWLVAIDTPPGSQADNEVHPSDEKES